MYTGSVCSIGDKLRIEQMLTTNVKYASTGTQYLGVAFVHH